MTLVRNSVMAAMLFLPFAAVAQTSNDVPPQLRNVRVQQKLNSQVPLDLKFRQENGEFVTLRQLMRGKPVILSLVYYTCPRLCSMTLTGLLKALRTLDFNVGREFDVLTVSFDPRETAQIATAKKAAYMEGYGRENASAGWHFLTGEQRDIIRLTNAVGFGFEFDTTQEQFSHASVIMILTPEGRVSRYFFGLEFPPRDLRLGLVEAADRKIGSVADQFLLYCFEYDPHTGKYSVAIMNVIRVFGAITVILILAFIAYTLRRDSLRKRARLREALMS
jgi:protein SCO1/2